MSTERKFPEGSGEKLLRFTIGGSVDRAANMVMEQCLHGISPSPMNQIMRSDHFVINGTYADTALMSSEM